jgi:hypothetical protein
MGHRRPQPIVEARKSAHLRMTAECAAMGKSPRITLRSIRATAANRKIDGSPALRHCERSEAIQTLSVQTFWIASSQGLLAMTVEAAAR